MERDEILDAMRVIKAAMITDIEENGYDSSEVARLLVRELLKPDVDAIQETIESMESYANSKMPLPPDDIGRYANTLSSKMAALIEAHGKSLFVLTHMEEI